MSRMERRLRYRHLWHCDCPEHGTTFEELYQKSDQMLYEVKRSVENGYRLYQEKESEHETDFNCR